MEFDWDTANLDHIERHGVSPEEAEEGMTGKTEDGRLLTVILTRRGKLSRVVTGYCA